MTFSLKLRSGFNHLAVALILGMGNEAAHAIAHAPQPHTDSHERIACQMERLREAQSYRNVHKSAVTGVNKRPPGGGQRPQPIPQMTAADLG